MGLVRKYNVVKEVPKSPLRAELRQEKKRRKKLIGKMRKGSNGTGVRASVLLEL